MLAISSHSAFPETCLETPKKQASRSFPEPFRACLLRLASPAVAPGLVPPFAAFGMQRKPPARQTSTKHTICSLMIRPTFRRTIGVKQKHDHRKASVITAVERLFDVDHGQESVKPTKQSARVN